LRDRRPDAATKKSKDSHEDTKNTKKSFFGPPRRARAERQTDERAHQTCCLNILAVASLRVLRDFVAVI